MKLAKALQLRKQLGRSLDVLQRRAQADAVRQPDYQGKLPAQVNDPNAVVRDMLSTMQKLTILIDKINAANHIVVVVHGDIPMKLGEAVVLRDQMLAMSTRLADLGSIRARGAGSVLDLDVKLTERTANELAREARQLDDLIQERNWQVDLDVEIEDALPEHPTGDPDDEDDADDSFED